MANGKLAIVPKPTIEDNAMKFVDLADFELLPNSYVLYKPTGSVIPNSLENKHYVEYLKLAKQ